MMTQAYKGTGELHSGSHAGHWAKCGCCGWVGPESSLPIDPNGHQCGKDECPDCMAENVITCCYPTREAAECG